VEIFHGNWPKSIYKFTQTGTNLAAHSEVVHTFPSFTVDSTGNYAVAAYVEFSEDIDLSNNLHEFFFPVKLNPQLGLEFLAKVLGSTTFADPLRAQVFASDEALPPGTKLQSRDKSELDLTLADHTYVGWVNPNKFTRFAHESFIVTQKYGDTTLTYHPIKLWPLINGVTFPSDSLRDSVMIFGSEITWPAGDSANISTGTSTTPPADSVCALIVSGEPENERQRLATEEDLNLIENNLRLEPKGPRLASGKITRISNATRAQILDAIHMMKNKCKKIIFYYTGHGEDGWMVTQGGAYTLYVELWQALFGTGAKDLTVMIDACYSGSAIAPAQIVAGYPETNVTIMTASSKDSVSWFDGVKLGSGKTWTSSLYTWAWAKGFGNPEADYDSDGTVTEVEAHLWAMKLNPVKHGLPMDSLSRPQLHLHRAVKPVAVGVPVLTPDIDLDVTPKTSSSLSVDLSVVLDHSIYGTNSIVPLDTNSSDPSTFRVWNIKPTGNLDYNFDLKFKYQPSLDLLPPSKSGYEPGIIRFDSAKAEWQAHYPSVWDQINRTVQAIDVSHFSPWALAMVKLQVKEDVTPNGSHSIRLVTYPNPFDERIAVKIETDQPDLVTIRVFDMTGRDAIAPFSIRLNPGIYTINLDGSELSSGSYNLVVAGGHVSQRQLLIRQ
jgi:hypothetical protein